MSEEIRYHLCQVVEYTTDKKYYDRDHNRAIIIENPIENKIIVVQDKNKKPPLYISIDDKLLMFGRYQVVDKPMKANVIWLNELDLKTKFVYKHTFDILKKYAEELLKEEINDEYLKMFNHMFEG